jgi:hypothetical protein
MFCLCIHAEEELDFDENLEPIVKSPYTSGSNTPRINGNPRKNAFSTEGLEEWQIDQMMKEVFGESASGFDAAGLSKEEQDAYWQQKENRDKNRKNSEPSSDPARPNPFSTEGLEEWQIDQMVEEVFGESASGFEAAGLSEKEQNAYWQRKGNRDKNRKNSKPPSDRPAPARPNPFSTEGLEEWPIDQMVEEIFGKNESGLEAAGLSKEEQDAYWQRSGGKPGRISQAHRKETQTRQQSCRAKKCWR